MTFRPRRSASWMLAAVSLAVAAATFRARSDDGSQVEKLIDLLALEPGMSVADVGAGSGEMTTLMARRLGASARVYSTDINDERLAEIRTAVAREGLENVIVVKGSERATNLPDASCDAVFIRDVYHHFVDPGAMNRSLFAALKPGGRLAVIDFAPSSGSKLPQGVPENRGGHGVSPEQIVEEGRRCRLHPRASTRRLGRKDVSGAVSQAVDGVAVNAAPVGP